MISMIAAHPIYSRDVQSSLNLGLDRHLEQSHDARLTTKKNHRQWKQKTNRPPTHPAMQRCSLVERHSISDKGNDTNGVRQSKRSRTQ